MPLTAEPSRPAVRELVTPAGTTAILDPAAEALRTRRIRRIELTLIIGWWALYGVFSTGQRLLYSAAQGNPLSAPDAASRALLGSVVWALITLAAFSLSRRFPIDRSPHARNVSIHIVAGSAIAFLEVVVAFAINEATGWFGEMPFSELFFMGFPSNVIYYWLLVGVGHGIDFYWRFRMREQQAAALQARLARAELHLLKTQLNPHFLFNSLHAISALMHRDVKAADRMLARLSELLRVTLDHVGTNVVTLREELDFLEPYVEIERTRIGERLTVRMTIDPETLDASVPHMILQPLVENAVRHAIAPRAAPGLITVVSRRAGDRLELEVADNGAGTATARPGKGLGLANTRSRLEQLYGNDFRFDAGDAPAGGFLVALSIPFHAAPSEETAEMHEKVVMS